MDGNQMQKYQAKNPVPRDSEFSRETGIMDVMEREFRQIFCTAENINFAKCFQDGLAVTGGKKY